MTTDDDHDEEVDAAPGNGPVVPIASGRPDRTARATTRTPPRRRAGRAQPDVVAAIAAGGAIGAPARYEVAQLIPVAGGSFPWATFSANLSGSFVLGFVLVLLIERFPPTRYLRAFIAIGFIGSYTTFSTYMVETDLLLKDGHVAIAAVYLIGSALAGLFAVWIGIIFARLLPLNRNEP